MRTIGFAVVVASAAGTPRTNHQLDTEWLRRCGAVVRRYWQEMSGHREDIEWTIYPRVELDAPTNGDAAASAAAVRAALAETPTPVGPDEVVLAILDWKGQRGGQALHDAAFGAETLSPAIICHELGHVYQRRANRPGGHASVFNGFLTLDYDDWTCIMGPSPGLAFSSSTLTSAGHGHAATGPAMCPPATAQCGWLDPRHPTAVIDVAAMPPGGVIVRPWRGAPVELHQGPPIVIVGHAMAPGGAPVHISLRAHNGWDEGFLPVAEWSHGIPHTQETEVRVVAQELARSGATFLLGQMPAHPGAAMRLGRAPLRVEVREASIHQALIDARVDPWRQWGRLPGPALHRAARLAAVARDGGIDVFVVGTDRLVHTIRLVGDRWGRWESLQGAGFEPTAGIAAASSTPASIDLFVVGDDRLVRRHRRVDGEWEEPWPIVDGGNLGPRSTLAATATAPGRIELFATDDDGRVVRSTVTDDAGTWEVLPPVELARAVAAVTLHGDAIQVNVVSEGADDQRVLHLTGRAWAWPETWTPHRLFGVVEEAGVAAARPHPGSSEVVVPVPGVTGSDLLVRSSDAGVWADPAVRVDGLPPAVDHWNVAAACPDPKTLIAFTITNGTIHTISRSLDPDHSPPGVQVLRQYDVALRASGGRFVRLVEQSMWAGFLFADGATIEPATTFTVCEYGDYQSWGTRTMVSIQSHDGRFVQAVDGGGNFLRVGATKLGPWERFIMAGAPAHEDLVTLCALGGHFWSAQGGDHIVMCDRVDVGEWERYQLVPVV